MTRAAVLYYMEYATQAQVAERLGISRVMAGRLIRQARDDGIVEITVHAPAAITDRLEAQVATRFGLRHVLLGADHTDEGMRREFVARRVGEYLLRHIRDGMTIAVGMGRNVSGVADAIRQAPGRDCTFVAAIGGSPSAARSVDAGEACRKLAERFGAHGACLYAPAYAESSDVRRAFLEHDDVRSTLARAASADVAIVGIGDAEDDSAVVRMGCFSARDMKRMRAAGAVGDILGSFFDLKGRPVAAGMRDRVISLGSDELKDIACVIGAASDAGKARAILGALRSGMLDVLATSVANAREVLSLDDAPGGQSDG
jgi:DNA-binding transcriptional regulator LsrR (DeoR family)